MFSDWSLSIPTFPTITILLLLSQLFLQVFVSPSAPLWHFYCFPPFSILSPFSSHCHFISSLPCLLYHNILTLHIFLMTVRATLLSSSQHPKSLLLETSKSHLWLLVGCPWPQRSSQKHYDNHPAKGSHLAMSATTQIPVNWLRRTPKGRSWFLGLTGA